MTACKKFKRGKEFSIEDLYRNKNFVPPKEQNLETIFEEPRQTKDGAPILTSTRKYKRYLDFDPITGKVQKPKKKIKRCVKKIKGKTRSASKSIQNIDINAILETLSDSSDDCDMDLTFNTSECGDGDYVIKNSLNVLHIEDKTMNDSSVVKTLNVNGDEDKTVYVDENKVINDVRCKKCILVKKCCTCELVQTKITDDKNETGTASSIKPCTVTYIN